MDCLTMTATTCNDCIVHNWKYLSEFYENINKIRQTDEFSSFVLQQLLKRCCSCHDQKGESVFTVDYLKELCQKIELSDESEPITYNPLPVYYMILNFPSTFTHGQRMRKIGRFIGRKGENLHHLECRLDVRLNIVNEKSSKYYCNVVNHFKKQNEQCDKNSVWLLIHVKYSYKNKMDIEKVKLSLRTEWNLTDVSIKEKRSRKYIRSENRLSSIPFDDGDTRWIPKKRSK